MKKVDSTSYPLNKQSSIQLCVFKTAGHFCAWVRVDALLPVNTSICNVPYKAKTVNTLLFGVFRLFGVFCVFPA